MIDFRYHIVSLIAVFLALAIGIVLGAGPLRAPIGDGLNEQLEALREERNAARAQVEEQQAWIEASGPQLVDSLLENTTVAVVELPGADGGVANDLVDQVGRAGGTLASRVTLTPLWVDADATAERAAVANQISSSLQRPPGPDAEAATTLGTGLAEALTTSSIALPGQLTAEADTILDALVAADLLSTSEDVDTPADVVLLVAPASDDDVSDAARSVEIATVGGFASTDAVLAGTATEASDLVNAVRDADVAARVSTVDGVDALAGQIIVPMVLAAQARGAGIDHYGLAGTANAVLPTVLALPTQTPEPTEPRTGGDEEPGDGSMQEPTEEPSDAAEEGTTSGSQDASAVQSAVELRA